MQTLLKANFMTLLTIFCPPFASVLRTNLLQNVAVMKNPDGRTSYIAQAYVLADSGITNYGQV